MISAPFARLSPKTGSPVPYDGADTKIPLIELQIGDRLADETGEWEVTGRPYTTDGGKTALVRVQRIGRPDTSAIRTKGK